MSEIINNAEKKREKLKELILKLHRGVDPGRVRDELKDILGRIPYDDVVRVEQELIDGGLPQEEVVKLCDIHTAVLEGSIDRSGEKTVPTGHPVDTFKEENRALEVLIDRIEGLCVEAEETSAGKTGKIHLELVEAVNGLMDVEKHYQRKENLLFPYLEKHGITAPPAVMWAKHDETRALLKNALQGLRESGGGGADMAAALAAVREASRSVHEMIGKEDQILFPMSLDTLAVDEWYRIYRQSPGIGFCLYDPGDAWKPEGVVEEETESHGRDGRVVLPTGSLSPREITSLLNALPVDVTFIGADDRVKYFSQGRDRVFTRSRAIIGRLVQQCHPPASVSTVQKILDDFRSGAQDSAAFWIEYRGRFVHIEYVALRDESGDYLGTIEVTQDLTEKRKIEGERRLLNYS